MFCHKERNLCRHLWTSSVETIIWRLCSFFGWKSKVHTNLAKLKGGSDRQTILQQTSALYYRLPNFFFAGWRKFPIFIFDALLQDRNSRANRRKEKLFESSENSNCQVQLLPPRFKNPNWFVERTTFVCFFYLLLQTCCRQYPHSANFQQIARTMHA